MGTTPLSFCLRRLHHLSAHMYSAAEANSAMLLLDQLLSLAID